MKCTFSNFILHNLSKEDNPLIYLNLYSLKQKVRKKKRTRNRFGFFCPIFSIIGMWKSLRGITNSQRLQEENEEQKPILNCFIFCQLMHSQTCKSLILSRFQQGQDAHYIVAMQLRSPLFELKLLSFPQSKSNLIRSNQLSVIISFMISRITIKFLYN